MSAYGGFVVRAIAGHESTETTKRCDLRGEGAKREAAERLYVPYLGRHSLQGGSHEW